MKKVYKSKIGLELLVPIMLVFGAILFIPVSEIPNPVGIGIVSLAIIFTIHLFMTTNYTIEGDNLTIKSGFFFNKTIDIKTITKISETDNALSSPATSLERIEINCGKFDSVIISPKLKKEFIDEIIAINSSVEVNYKKK